MNINGNDSKLGAYYRHRRESISQYINNSGARVLDVGCASGNFGAYLKSAGKAMQVDGIELDEAAAAEAGVKLDAVYCADMNASGIDAILGYSAEIKYDYIVCADVLEHLIDPWTALAELAERLKPGGQVVASIPNVRHMSVVVPLVLRGAWAYRDSGIMDRTHLRFFTKATALEMFRACSLNPVRIEPLIGNRWKLLDKLSFGLLRPFLTVQWVIVAEIVKR